MHYSERQHQQTRYENWVTLNSNAKQAASTLSLKKPPVLEIDGIHPPEDVTEEDEMINDVTLDLSHATIEAEALEFEDAAAMERVPHADVGGIDGVSSGGGLGAGSVAMNGNGPVSEHKTDFLLVVSFGAHGCLYRITMMDPRLRLLGHMCDARVLYQVRSRTFRLLHWHIFLHYLVSLVDQGVLRDLQTHRSPGLDR